MKIKRILFFLILFLIISHSSKAAEAIDFDLSKIVNAYNSYPYVLALKELGINIKATQAGNDYILTYNDTDTVTFNYIESENMLHTTYSFNGRTNSDILSSIFVDCISNLQGNEVGSQLPFYSGDTFALTFYRNAGISREYLSNASGNIVVDCKLNPFMKLDIPEDHSEISESTFISSALDFYNKNQCVAKENGLICYKNVVDDTTYEIYIGKPNSLDNLAYSSVVTAISLLTKYDGIDKQKAIMYLQQNYSGFEKGNYEFDGIKIETDIPELPIKNQDTILVGNNMKYAKFTVSKKIFEEQASKIQVNSPNANDSIKSETSDNKIVVGIIVIYIAIMAVIGIIALKAIIKK